MGRADIRNPRENETKTQNKNTFQVSTPRTAMEKPYGTTKIRDRRGVSDGRYHLCNLLIPPTVKLPEWGVVPATLTDFSFTPKANLTRPQNKHACINQPADPSTTMWPQKYGMQHLRHSCQGSWTNDIFANSAYVKNQKPRDVAYLQRGSNDGGRRNGRNLLYPSTVTSPVRRQAREGGQAGARLGSHCSHRPCEEQRTNTDRLSAL